MYATFAETFFGSSDGVDSGRADGTAAAGATGFEGREGLIESRSFAKIFFSMTS